MRFVALWKYGGVYLDLSFMILRPLAELGEDWAVAEGASAVGSGALSVSARRGSAGAQVADACVRALAAGAAPSPVTSVLARRCGNNATVAMADCGGFRVLPEEQFFPVNFTLWQLYFSEKYANEMLSKLRRAYAVHLWNKESRISRLTVPNSAYARMARESCPDAYRRALYDN